MHKGSCYRRFWSSTENSSTNAWNVNFNSGNRNTNNKYNSNLYVRPVLALEKQNIYIVRIRLITVSLRVQFYFIKGLPTAYAVKKIVVAVIGSHGPLPRGLQRMRGT